MSAAAAPRPVVDQPSSADPSASSLSPPQSSPSPSPSSPSPSPSSSRSPSPSPSSSSSPSPPPRTRGPTPMDLAWRQVALDEAAGRLPPFVAETEADRKIERIGEKLRGQAAKLRHIRELRGKDDAAYWDAIDEYICGDRVAWCSGRGYE